MNLRQRHSQARAIQGQADSSAARAERRALPAESIPRSLPERFEFRGLNSGGRFTSPALGVNYFVGRTQAWLENQLAQCQEDLAAGKTRITWGAGESSSGSLKTTSPQQRYADLYFALSVLDPDTYPPANQPTRRTTPRYVYGS